jgi:hypothetical protein
MREGIDKTEGIENMGEEIEMIGVEIIKGAQKEACLISVSLENKIETKRREQQIKMILRRWQEI